MQKAVKMWLKNVLKGTKRRLQKHKKLLLVYSTVCVCFLVWFWLSHESPQKPATLEHGMTFKLLWWTKNMPNNYQEIRYCSTHKCLFTTDRQALQQAAAVLFYASDMAIEDLPLPRRTTHVWGLLHEESPRNVPFIAHNAVLQHFNYSSTFSRHSDFPITLQYLPRLDMLTKANFMLPIGQKTLLRTEEQLSAIVFIQSDCDTMSGRDEYVRQLMQHIPIDSYGKCLHNRNLPNSLTVNYLNNLYSEEMLRFLGRYKFVLSYENGICDDYITEKFWRPLIVGAVPIYFGAPTIKDWQPHDKSVIHISDFASPKLLAEFIKKLDTNDTEYNTYLKHKYDMLEPISNKLLLHELQKRDYEGNKDIFSYFECSVCRHLYERRPEHEQRANLSHYKCAVPLAYPPMERRSVSTNNNNNDEGGDNGWEWIVATGRCQAHVLHSLLARNRNFTRQEFDMELNRAFEANECN